MMIKHSY